MFDTKFFDELAKKISDVIPSGVKDVKHDIEKNIRTVLQSTFNKLDLVTREEFDVQTNVLARTRAKLEALEKRLNDIEKEIGPEALQQATNKAKAKADKKTDKSK